MTITVPETAALETSTEGQHRSLTTRDFQRQAITEHFLTALEDVVWRYRAMATHGEYAELYAEVVTAEVAHQLEVARNALHRYPMVR
ncbi:MAG TPA: hypothetical protein VFE65_30580 [Pseudonocardia sp.]|jgi:hypothetical protein|nr:hypothetical protein [Pseudonocardia sp.]